MSISSIFVNNIEVSLALTRGFCLTTFRHMLAGANNNKGF
jgi:hypothetical protein